MSGFSPPALPVGVPIPWPGRKTPPTGFVLCNGQALSRTTYAALFAVLMAAATVTMTIASPCVVTWTGNDLEDGDPIKFTTSGALPTGLTAGVTYYVKSPSGSTFNVAATPGGSAINTSGTQSGTHTGISAPYGDGDGSTTFNVPDYRGRTPIGHDVMANAAASRVTNAGSGIYGASQGQTGGAETHTLTTAQMPSHTHAPASGSYFITNQAASTLAISGAQTYNIEAGSTAQGSGNAHNNMQPIIVQRWIMRAA